MDRFYITEISVAIWFFLFCSECVRTLTLFIKSCECVRTLTLFIKSCECVRTLTLFIKSCECVRTLTLFIKSCGCVRTLTLYKVVWVCQSSKVSCIAIRQVLHHTRLCVEPVKSQSQRSDLYCGPSKLLPRILYEYLYCRVCLARKPDENFICQQLAGVAGNRYFYFNFYLVLLFLNFICLYILIIYLLLLIVIFHFVNKMNKINIKMNISNKMNNNNETRMMYDMKQD